MLLNSLFVGKRFLIKSIFRISRFYTCQLTPPKSTIACNSFNIPRIYKQTQNIHFSWLLQKNLIINIYCDPTITVVYCYHKYYHIVFYISPTQQITVIVDTPDVNHFY